MPTSTLYRSVVMSLLAFTLSCFTLPAMSYEAGDILLRLGYANLDPREDIDPVFVNGNINLGGLSMESQRTPMLTGTVMMNEKLGLELILPLATVDLEFGGKGGAIDGLAIGESEVAPYALTLQYYPMETQWAKPYIGIGVNYLHIKNTRINPQNASLLGIDSVESLKIKDSYGIVLQAGVDLPVTEHLSVNLSSSFIDMKSEATSRFHSNGMLFKAETEMKLKNQPNLTVIGITYQL